MAGRQTEYTTAASERETHLSVQPQMLENVNTHQKFAELSKKFDRRL